jgi:hypothetical protein
MTRISGRGMEYESAYRNGSTDETTKFARNGRNQRGRSALRRDRKIRKHWVWDATALLALSAC